MLHPSTLTLAKLKQEVGWPQDGIIGLASLKVTGFVLAYYFLSLVLWAVLPGVETEGVQLSSGGRLKYKFNGSLRRPQNVEVNTDGFQHSIRLLSS